MSISFSALSSSTMEVKIACCRLHKITEIAEAILQYCRCNILNVQGSKHQRSKTLIVVCMEGNQNSVFRTLTSVSVGSTMVLGYGDFIVSVKGVSHGNTCMDDSKQHRSFYISILAFV